MIHCLAARHVALTRGPLFYVGNLAPDAMHYPDKERLHLRLCDDRAAALSALARRSDPADDFAEGVLLHLYTDWLWDGTHLRRYRDSQDPGDPMWFKRYQHETGLASAWLYRNHGWAPALWESMLAVPMSDYGALEGVTPESIASYLTRNSRLLAESNGPPSRVYPPELAEDFAQETARRYQSWRAKSLCIMN